MKTGPYSHELDATRVVRDALPNMPAARLARLLHEPGTQAGLIGALPGIELIPAVRVASLAPYYTIYSRIRRYDAKRKQANQER